MNSRGTTTAEYVGIVVVVVVMFLGLLALRSTDLGRRAPVRPLPAILKLITLPVKPIVRVRPLPPVRPRGPGRTRSPRLGPPPVLLPTWVGGGRP